jgi:hypothetical protein
LQHADDTVLAEFVQDRVVNAAKGQGLEPEELLEEEHLISCSFTQMTVLGYKWAPPLF